MAILDLLKPKPKVFFTKAEQHNIVEAIHAAEKMTSGQVRVFVESKCRFLDAIDRAKEVFYTLEMEKTSHHNATLVYIATKDKQMAVFGDAGIYEKTGQFFWHDALKKMHAHLRNKNISQAIIDTIGDIGNALQQHFPYDALTDKNELPDDIVFGK